MYSYSRTSPDPPLTVETTSWAGNSSSLTSVQNNVLTALNADHHGNVQGDHKSPNPFGYLKVVSRSGYGVKYSHFYLTYNAGSRRTVGYIGGPTPLQLLVPDYSFTDDAAWERVYDQLRGNSQIIIDLAESNQTLRMLRNTLNLKKLFRDFYENIVKSRGYRRISGPTQGQRRLDYVTAKWLEYRYGWTPLVHSIYDAADNIARREVNRVISVKGWKTVKQFKEKVDGSGTEASPNVRHEDSLSFRTLVKCRFKLPGGNQIYDWTSLNPVKIAWELTSLSFLGDWVMNISQVLDSFENYWLFRSLFVDGFVSNSHKQVRTLEFSYNESSPLILDPFGNPYDQTYSWGAKGKADVTQTQHIRNVITTLPLSASPRFNVNIGAKRQLDAAALFQQMIAKRMR